MIRATLAFFAFLLSLLPVVVQPPAPLPETVLRQSPVITRTLEIRG